MQTENKSNNQKVSLEGLKSIEEIYAQKMLPNMVELLKTGKTRIEILIKNAREKAKFLRNADSDLSKKDESSFSTNIAFENEVSKDNNSGAVSSSAQENVSTIENVSAPLSEVDNKVEIKSTEVDDKREKRVIESKDTHSQNKFDKSNGDKRKENNKFNGQSNFNRNNAQNGERKQFVRGDRQDFRQNKTNNRPFGNQNGMNQNRQYNGQNPQNRNKKIVFADTSVLENNTKNKHANSISKKKQEVKRYEDSSRRKIITKNGLSELDLGADERFEGRKLKKKNKGQDNPQFIKVESAVITTEKVSVKTLSEKIGQTVASIIKKLMLLGTMATINTDIDFATAELIADEFNVKLEHKVEKTADEKLLEEVKAQNEEGNTYHRSPVVTVMGHVDHGKTSLLDAIRNTDVTSGEAGGITQHIGAYTIDYKGNPITFIDTPGHEAFSAMRARGASVTDVAILVVAADDGVMPQTKESIAQIKQAGVPMVVAINKIDKNDANPERIKQQLAELDVMPEEWGGDTVMVNISARNNINIDKLLEMVLLVSEVSDLRCNLDRSAIGTVIEAKLDKGKGPVATVLIQNGTLHVGDTIISGLAVGRVRAMMDDKGKNVKSAGPSTPVSVLGLDRVPNAGDKILAVDEQVAKQVVVDRKNKVQIQKQNAQVSMSAEELLKKMENKKPYNVIVKTDVQGSYEALVHILNSIENEEIQVVCVHGGVGAVNETDVDMAIASKAHIIAFNTKAESNASNQAEERDIKIDYYKVIYEVIEDVKKEIKALLTPVYEEKVVGHCEVRVLFKISRIGTVAGCYVLDGKIPKNAQIALMRNGEIVVKTGIVTLQKDRQDVKEVMAGYECGIKLDGFDAIKELDIFEAIVLERVER